ncbi:tumor necrosis factor receptor superfamily member 10B [Opisthocomus hoazin]|uniref:tumor necrosis factor receptor superfamily member 10B n=1 Tax=Opisthocomus hoazin TaxID=30419 RepID=UPI003F52958F
MRPALRASPRRRCLPLLLLVVVTEVVLGASLDRRDKLDSLDPNRGGEDLQVPDTSRSGKKCPAGTYVAEHSKEPNGSSECLPCKEDEYIEYPNDFPRCLGCRKCREDEVELSPCRAVSNTQCACKNGTFCSPDHPCEMCQKCRPRCPKDEVELAPCTPHSDRRCGPPTSTTSDSSGTLIVTSVVVVVVAAAVLLALSFFTWKSRCCRSPGDRRDLSGKSCSVVDYLVRQLTRYRRGGQGTQDNRHNEQLSRDQLLPRGPGSGTHNTPGSEVTRPRTSYPSVKPRRNLVPVQGEDPIMVLRRSFDIFARDVPYKDWKRYGRALDLLENDIALAEMNDRYSLEPFFQMLNMWQNRQGMKASVNMLLEALHQINLGGIAEDISSKLVQQGSFQYEVS